MNELGKPDGKRSRGCRYWWKDAIHYNYGGLQPKEKGWTDEDWKKFQRGEPVREDEDDGQVLRKTGSLQETL